MDLVQAAVEQARTEGIRWTMSWRAMKYHEDLGLFLAEGRGDERAFAELHTPFEVREIPGNLLVNNGAQLLLDALIGTAITAFSNANARIGVGDSTTAAAATQTDLQAATNKLRKAMDATFPSRAGQTMSWKSSFTSAEANFAWQEWAIFNAASGATSMLNRKVESLGTKTTGTWTLQGDLTLS
jgi:hypothetical protein